MEDTTPATSVNDPVHLAAGEQKLSKVTFHSEPQITLDRRPRKMTREACEATELLEHAIAYLTDSRELPSGRVSELDPRHPDVYALLLLMEAKYQAYVDCPLIERRRSAIGGLFKGKDRRRQPWTPESL